MSGPRERTIGLAHLRLAALEWGEADAPPLLALHGWLDNAATFERLAPLLCARFHVVALDLPGHGRSEHRPAGTWYHYIDYLSDVLAAADALGWERFGLLGHSLGGALASVLAPAFPERIERLLLIEALGPPTGPADQALAQLQRGLRQRRDVAEKALRVYADSETAARARAQAGAMSIEAARILVARGLRALEGGWVWSSDQRLTLASPHRFVEAQVLAVLAGIRAPTKLVLAQPAPEFLREDIVAARIAQVPGIEVTRLPGHHHLHLEDPEPVAAALLP
jgi:pimeloyl-ACP methyl ester carboxylesterase